MDIDGKVAVITGGASGLGRATAKMIVDHGGRVALLDRNLELAQETAGALGGAARAFAVDVRDAESARTAIDAVMEAFGAIHIDVNCAGIGPPGRTVGRDGPLSLDLFNLVIQVNLVGTFNTLRLCAAHMQENTPDNGDGERGVIVNTASVAAFEGQVGQAAYSASKGGVVGMTVPVARDLARSGIRVCTIAPGVFGTPMLAAAPPSVREPLVAATLHPKRLGEAPEFASLVRQIVENPYLNGETIRLDAGIRMQPR
ncbi:MAG: SDR family NAD(P)-dependent oxidoreductase [Gammaproteobacteria bacterium]|nr:SDR family NAD(P)-dependent oxidoreductase [Gammaproteobacteria bacterium]